MKKGIIGFTVAGAAMIVAIVFVLKKKGRNV